MYLYFYVYHFVIKGIPSPMVQMTCVFASMTIPILDSNLILDSIAAKKLRNNAQIISGPGLLILVKLIALERH